MTSPVLAGMFGLLLAAPAPGPAAGAPTPPPGKVDLPWMIGPEAGVPTRPRPPLDARLRALGRSLYQARCGHCHGERGDGKGRLAPRLDPPPTDFSRAVFKVRSTPPGALPTDLDLFRTLTRGMHGTAMIPWHHLDERQRWALVHHLKSFSPRFQLQPAPEALRVPLAPRETGDIQDHGEALYVRLRCGACHGDSGAGDGPARERLRQTGDRRIRARDFTRGRFIRGTEMEDIYLTLRVGVEGTPMAAYPSLRDDELWALAAYVRLLIHERPIHELPPARSLAEQQASGPDAKPVMP